MELGKKPGMLGTIFRKAQNRIQDPAKLKRLVTDLIDRETWTTLGVDVKGDAYEGLLEKNACDVKGGAGQYFTPRALIQAIVDVTRPKPGQLIHDPACGTGGFLLAVHDYISHNFTLDKDEKRFLMEKALSGVEIVDGAAWSFTCRNRFRSWLPSGKSPWGWERRHDGPTSICAEQSTSCMRLTTVLESPP